MKYLQEELVKLSGNNEQTAIAILKQSIAKGWTGLFELKQDNKNGKQEDDPYRKAAEIFLKRNQANKL